MKILQVFNRYQFSGGEEKSVERIRSHLEREHEVTRLQFESSDWLGPGAPSKISQVRRLFYNPESRASFEDMTDSIRPDVALFHNIYPVGSPSLYHAARLRGLPVVQYLHNFRPFSVGGALWAGGSLAPEALRGDYRREIRSGAWRDSKLQSAMFALVLKRLHRSGWLDCVKAWVAISEFMRDRLVEAGQPAGKMHALRHSWDALPDAPTGDDKGYYLFLGRLVEVKGVRVLLDAWDLLREKLGTKTPGLRIAGEGPLEEYVKSRMAANLAISFIGQIEGEKKSEELRHCRAVVVPSVWWEPLGLVVYEAYDHAKPVLAAQSGGLIETVQQAVTGLLHEAGSSAALAGDVESLESMNPSARAAMGAEGREWLLKEADSNLWLSRMNAILGSVA